ncbi:MAG TPA: lipoyl(octanoyl) transferase LipB [Candidatus Binataceae bacterium]|nr:lipoyl(octanoyl) transferase LipB [Candidatus Binataceae bacterium]
MSPHRSLDVARLGVVQYETALTLQTAMVAARIEDRIGDTLLLLEHPHVLTLGRGADERFIVDNGAHLPVFRVSRGGQVTYHGPGQLVAYPILRLEGAARDVGAYLRNLEQVMIDALSRYGIVAERRKGLTGVWIGTRKIASIGVGLKRWVTYHGLAINVSTDLDRFAAIVPCGIDGCEMASVAGEGHPEVTMREFGDALAMAFGAVFGHDVITTIESAALWRLVDTSANIPQAR